MTTTLDSITGADPYVTPDERDEQILADRMAKLDTIEGPRVGDFVIFADGVTRRFSHDWDEMGLQTSDGGSFHLGNGYVSFSGGLHPTVLRDTLTDTGETRNGSVWFFHHNLWKAHNAVHASVPFRVFSCSLRSDERRRVVPCIVCGDYFDPTVNDLSTCEDCREPL